MTFNKVVFVQNQPNPNGGRYRYCVSMVYVEHTFLAASQPNRIFVYMNSKNLKLNRQVAESYESAV